MILLDAYALIALLLDEPAAAEVEQLIRAGGCAIPATNLGEVVDQLVRRGGRSPREVDHVLDTLADSIEVTPVTERIGHRAGLLRARHYAPRTCEVSLTDCTLVATAADGDRAATSDPPLAAVLRVERIEVVALPDSHGRRPSGG